MSAPLLSGPRLQPASGGPARQLVVILHGYGADGADLIDIGRAWPTVLPDAMFVAPDAPSALPSDILGGRQWFPLSERTPQEYRIGAEAVHPLLDQYLDAELAALNLPGDALALVGFSQGAMCALHCGLRRKTPPSAIVGYSGLLPGASTGGGQLDGIQTSTPVLIVHGAQDDVVPAYHADAAGQALSAAGVANTVHVYDNLGHSIDERGMRAAGLFLKEAFGMPG